jgi:hypothetical protein
MTTPLSGLFASLPSVEQVHLWEEECRRIDAHIEELKGRRDKFAQMIELAKGLTESAPAPQPQPQPQREKVNDPPEVTSAEAPRRLKKGGPRRREQTWRSAVEVIVRAHPGGISYEQIKQSVPPHLKAQLEEFPEGKGFYTALRRLEADGVIVRHNSMAFSKEGYARYLERVAAGEIEKASKRRGSPMEDAIKDFLSNHGAAKGVAIRAHLIQFDEFAGPVIRNSSAMYNVLLRLKKSGEILHDEETSTYFVPQKENGAHNGDAAGAPETARVAALPTENQPTLRLIG